MKNVLITGVSKGLGLDIARVFLENNWAVWGISRTQTEAVQLLLNTYPDHFFWKPFCLSGTDKIKEDLFGNFITYDVPLEAFINNAASAYDDIITNINLNSLEMMYRVNVFAPMIICKHAIRNMLFHKTPGSIVHISSISAHTGYKGLAMYASSKGLSLIHI